MNYIKYFRVLITLLVLVGCKHDNNGDVDNIIITDLEGNWLSSCSYLPSDDLYQNVELQFKGNEFTYSEYNWFDENCSSPRYTFGARGTFEIGSSYILSSGETAKPIDLIRKSWFLTAKSDDYVTAYNDRSFCEVSVWQKDVEVDISSCEVSPSNTSIYDVFSIENDRLYLGDYTTGSQSSDENRPTKLNTVYFDKI